MARSSPWFRAFTVFALVATSVRGMRPEVKFVKLHLQRPETTFQKTTKIHQPARSTGPDLVARAQRAVEEQLAPWNQTGLKTVMVDRAQQQTRTFRDRRTAAGGTEKLLALGVGSEISLYTAAHVSSVSEWGAHSLQEVAMGLAITLSLSLAYGFLWMYIGGKLGLTDLVFGSPRYTWYVCIFDKCFVLIPIAFAAWLTSGLPLESYMRRQWLEGDARSDQWLEVLWIYALIFEMCKDFPAGGVAPIIALHHAVAISMGVVFLFAGPPGNFTFGGAILEIGSVVNSVASLVPNSLPAARANLAVMTLSNLFGVFAAYVTFTAVGTPTVIRRLFPPILLILVALRQREIITSYSETSRQQSSGATEPPMKACDDLHSNLS